MTSTAVFKAHADGKQGILGFYGTSAGDSAWWLTFYRGIAARGLSGAALKP